MNSSETNLLLRLRRSQEFLKLEAIDVRFRVYDLLFACYPELASNLPVDRYNHPDIVSILFRRDSDIAVGVDAFNALLKIISPKNENELVSCLMLINQCLVKALQDVLTDELDDDLIAAYRHLIEYRVIQAVGGSAPEGLGSARSKNVSHA